MLQTIKMTGINADGTRFTLEYPFQHSDAGRANSKRPQAKSDCTVRALATALGLPYDEAYDILAEAGRKSGKRFQFTRWLDSCSLAKKISFPAVKAVRENYRKT